jgi:hypothetical protein
VKSYTNTKAPFGRAPKGAPAPAPQGSPPKWGGAPRLSGRSPRIRALQSGMEVSEPKKCGSARLQAALRAIGLLCPCEEVQAEAEDGANARRRSRRDGGGGWGQCEEAEPAWRRRRLGAVRGGGAGRERRPRARRRRCGRMDEEGRRKK